MAMAVKRQFLGWQRPALASTAEYLLARYRTGGAADLREALVVVPGRRAGRRLLEILVELAARHSLLLQPPEITTVGTLPERLYPRQRPFASELVQQLAWADTLRRADRSQLEAVFRKLPESHETRQWMDLASLLRTQHRELAAEGLDFEKVIQSGVRVDGFDESRRWRVLSQVQQAYLRLLDSLDVWDAQTARLVAVEKRECHAAHDLILVGTVDLSRVLRQMLDQVADRVTALVFAPESLHERFDAYGCLIVDSWQDVELPLASEQIEVVGGPAEQAEAVIRHIAGYAGRYGEDEVTLGILDPDLVPDVARQLQRHGVAGHWSAGRPLRELAPYRLLETLGRYLNGRRWIDFAALLRHEDVARRLAQHGLGGDWVSELDAYYAEHLPYRLTGQWLGEERGCARLQRAYRAIEEIAAPLTDQLRTLPKWGGVLTQVLLDFYRDREFDRQHPSDQALLGACQRIGDILQAQMEIPASLPSTVTVHDAIGLMLEQIAGERLATAPEPCRVEMLGWLDLPLDDAPVLILAGFNEPFVPSSLNSDLFLPNALRRELGLLDNDRRYARDAYALQLLLESRPSLHVIAGRRSRDGTPLMPSRLLFATDTQTAARRAIHLFGALPAPTPPPPIAPDEPDGEPHLPLPRPAPLGEKITRLSVTGFRAYLACPYRFYLTHVLRLETLRDDAEELDGAAFGLLAHEVLKRFGKGRSRHATDADVIRQALHRLLNRCVAERYGTDALPAVYVQVEQLRLRLDAFARCQAEWASQGWRIECTEVPHDGQGRSVLDVDGQSFTLTGRIDRIDRHAETGEWAVLDYKTSDSAATPEKSHRKGQQWTDLQLPLYRYLAASVLQGAHHENQSPPAAAADCRLGYICLPKDAQSAGLQLADWSQEELNGADEVARDVVRRIWREEFWPPADPPPPFAEHLAPLCQMD